jgi:hypothetical protein
MKKKQYVMLMCNLNQLKEVKGTLHLEWKDENFFTTSESLLIRQIQNIRKEINEKIKSWNNHEQVNLVSIETDKKGKEKLNKLIIDGFYIGDLHYSFIKLLGGSHHKQLKQFYTTDAILEKLQPRIDMKALTHTTRAKRLTSNALLTTDVYAVPYDLSKLNICIIPDNELNIEMPNLNGIVKYDYKDMTKEEQDKCDRKNVLDEDIENMFKAYSDLAKDNKFDYTKVQLAEGFNTYKTPSRWLKEDNRLVMLEEVTAPKYYTQNKEGSKFITYTENQTLPIDIELLEIAEWSTGYKLVEVNTISVNNFDGIALISTELGKGLQNYIQSDLENEEKHFITGYQLRLPQIKGFFPVVDIRTYFKNKSVSVIYDIFGQPHNTDTLDILGTESIFKAKLDTTSGKKTWMWKDIDEFIESMIKHKYDCIGVANYAHELRKNEFRNITYQFLSSLLKLSEYELLALATPQCKMIADVLNVYRNKDIDWCDIKYIQIYLNNILESKENDEDNYVETAIQMLNYNKYMVFDRKFTSFLFNHIKHELEQICLGRIKVHSNYLYVTGDILGFLKYASKFSDEKAECEDYRDKIATEKIEGFLKQDEFYMSKTVGEKVLIRNPLMKESEVEHAVFVDIEDEDTKYIKHLKNIIQCPMNTSIFQKMGGFDEDGDELHLIHLDYNLKSSNVDWLMNFHYENRIEALKKNIEGHFNIKYKNKDVVTFADLIRRDLKVQVNVNDKVGEEGTEWKIESIAGFILSSDDKTGKITDINTTILNYLNNLYSEVKSGELTKEEALSDIKHLVLANQIMKHKQGEMIDASKTGTSVDIPEIIEKKLNKRPYFYKYKGKEANKLINTNSALEKFCRKIEKLISIIDTTLDRKVNERVKKLEVTNLSSYLYNSKISSIECKPYEEALKKLNSEYSDKKAMLIQEKSKINMYSKTDDAKEARKSNKKKWSELIKETSDKAKEICPSNGIRGNAILTITYEQSKNYDFAWVAASDIFLARLENNQTDSYLVTKDENGDIEYLKKKYKVDVKKVKSKRVGNFKMDQTALKDYKLAVCVFKTEIEIKRDTLEKLKKKNFKELNLVEEDGFIKLSVDGINLAINQKYYAEGNLKQRIGQVVTLKDIKPFASSAKLLIDINC